MKAWRFIHIPKTGGTAFAQTYRNRGSIPCKDKHAKSSNFGDDVFLWAIFRDPFDRVVSAAAYDLRGVISKSKAHDTMTCPMFEGWLRTNDQRDWKAPQAHWVDERVTLINYSNLRAELPSVLERVGLDYKPMTKRYNESLRDHWVHYSTPLATDMVYDQYEQDFAMYARIIGRTPCKTPALPKRTNSVGVGNTSNG